MIDTRHWELRGPVRTMRSELAEWNVERADYQFDEQGNWTERIVSGRFAEGAAFSTFNVERRSIEYYPR